MPPGLLYEFAYENNTIIQSNDLKKYELVKHFNNHTFLKIMLNGRNQQWQKELFEVIQKENVSITFDEKDFKIISNVNPNIPFILWSYKIEYLISEYFKEFYMEIIKYGREQYQEIVGMMDKIEEIRKMYLIDYLNKLDSNSLFLIGRKIHI